MAKQGAGRSRKPLCTTTVHRVMQMGIAEGLKKWYEPPQELSEELARLLGTSESDRSLRWPRVSIGFDRIEAKLDQYANPGMCRPDDDSQPPPTTH